MRSACHNDVFRCFNRRYVEGMAERGDLRVWVVEALRQIGGEGTIVQVCQRIWQEHEKDLRASGDLFYTWQ